VVGATLPGPTYTGQDPSASGNLPALAVPTGHQWTPDIASATSSSTTRAATLGYAANVPPGNTTAGANSGDLINTFLARSTDCGTTWSEAQLSTHGSNFGWETHGARRVGFWGDDIYVSAVPGAVTPVWTDWRDLVPGVDPASRPPQTGSTSTSPAPTCPTTSTRRRTAPPESPTRMFDLGLLNQSIYIDWS
jgi:hypothetical protein